MNCQDVETVITDLARDSALEAGARDSALAHLKQCRRCGERLAEEQRLTEGLLAWNASLNGEQAPPRVEGKLRAAFRQSAMRAPRRRWPAVAGAGAIAAAILLFKLMAPQPDRVAPVAWVPPVAQVGVQGGAGDSPARIVKRNRQANRLPHQAAAVPAPVPTPTPSQPEVSTEFLPVVQGDGWTPFDGGRLVRVRLPRSAMGAFGLPVDERRAPERVQADVMLSDDGLLRAIRFVQ